MQPGKAVNLIADHWAGCPAVVLTVPEILGNIAMWKTEFAELFVRNHQRYHQTTSCCNEVRGHNSLAFPFGPNGLLALLSP